MRVLLLSAYDAASHARWHRELREYLPFDWTLRALPPRHFLWRRRGNALWWAIEERALLAESWDLLLVTSSVDLATLRGLAPALVGVPTVVYFHDNQVAFPDRRGDRRIDFNLAMQEATTALAADWVLFNSEYNRRSLLKGLARAFARMPDHVPAGFVEAIAEKSQVLSIPLADELYARASKRAGPLQLLWNHRWEFDKAPERLFAALTLLQERGVPFFVHVVGQRFRKAPMVFEGAREALGEHVGTWGYVESLDDYRRLLRHCDVVLSTALHEFQGLAVLEAMASGCVACVPDRLSYQEFVPVGERYESFPDDPEAEAVAMADHIEGLSLCGDGLVERDRQAVEALRWSRMVDQWGETLLRLGAPLGE